MTVSDVFLKIVPQMPSRTKSWAVPKFANCTVLGLKHITRGIKIVTVSVDLLHSHKPAVLVMYVRSSYWAWCSTSPLFSIWTFLISKTQEEQNKKRRPSTQSLEDPWLALAIETTVVATLLARSQYVGFQWKVVTPTVGIVLVLYCTLHCRLLKLWILAGSKVSEPLIVPWTNLRLLVGMLYVYYWSMGGVCIMFSIYKQQYKL